MAIHIKSPNPDEVWEKWKLKAARSQKLEKYYGIKGAVFNLESITAAEFVKDVNKGAIFYLEKSHDIQVSTKKPEEIVTIVPKIEKVTFYQFNGKVIKGEWKNNDEVPFFKSLTKVTCSECQGSGGIQCKKCKGTGFQTCSKCKGDKQSLTCKTCDGTGNILFEVVVKNEKGKTEKKQSQVRCPDCKTKKHFHCSKCHGSGKNVCGYCDGLGVNTCSNCKGYGVLYKYSIKPVPFKEEHEATPLVLSSLKLSGLESEIGQEIQKAIETVEGIRINTPKKELSQKFIEPTLGYFDKTIKKVANKVEKEWSIAEKDKHINIRGPIYLFPVLVMNCETRKGKKFQVVCIGSDKKFRVFGQI